MQKHPSEGGSYVVTAKGERELVSRTKDQPRPAEHLPVEKAPEAAAPAQSKTKGK